ncbi:ankyrin repeat domain-containing protein 2A-like isoform X3 [Penaeus chinensis]|uniref:ankyrin repeat domain-containing protein 2A-like isoform X3 n=1 Tax=Penaeus chinensis TaxID=139456 RepID=UPI001FB6B414|nr:ankyrin repeat domain-containing protein 2A-like isoform X3 [Penaeus chinensis]
MPYHTPVTSSHLVHVQQGRSELTTTAKRRKDAADAPTTTATYAPTATMAASARNARLEALIKAGNAEGLRAALAALSPDARADFFKRRTAMHLAALRGHWGALEALAAGGAGVDPVDNHGDTPLHDAASNRHLLAVGVLTGLGASTSKKTKKGKTPQDLLGNLSADKLFPMAEKCAATAAEKERRKMQEKLEEKEKEMKKRYDSKEAEAANLKKEIEKLKKNLQKLKLIKEKLEEQAKEMKTEIKKVETEYEAKLRDSNMALNIKDDEAADLKTDECV